MQNPENKAYDVKFEKIVKTMIYIFIIAFATYAVMAVITHFALNNMAEDYKFSQSLLAVFDTDTPMFKFAFDFGLLNLATVFIALILKLMKEQIL